MPVYEYQCQSCQMLFEKLQKFSDPPLTQCERCGGELKKLLSSPAIVFKGTGWYVTDYAGKKQGQEKPPEKTAENTKTDQGKTTDHSGAKPSSGEAKTEVSTQKKE